jgi:adhesin transport system membrane fusion protein
MLQNYKLDQVKNQLKQAKFKIISDSARLVGTQENLSIAKQQYLRAEELYQKKLNTINQLEQRKFALQDEQAKFIEHQNNLLNSENEKLNTEIQIISLVNEFQEKIAKLNSNKQSALSSKFGEDANLSVLENIYSNYKQRGKYHYILAPQDGHITRINKAGIGEIFKEGESIVTIMPVNYNLAIEMYVRPIDIPLIKKGGKVRINFDGWPSFIISGWPIISFGMYTGEIIAIDRYISENGLYRIMVAPVANEEKWPKNIKVGTGAESIVLFNEVPTWYEFWRQLNGFPPNYYKGNPEKQLSKTTNHKQIN